MSGHGLAFLTAYLYPFAAIVSAAASTATAAAGWRLYRQHKKHSRTLYGEPEIDGHDGLVTAVNENSEMVDTHRRALRREDLMPAGVDRPRHTRPNWRDDDADDDGSGGGARV